MAVGPQAACSLLWKVASLVSGSRVTLILPERLDCSADQLRTGLGAAGPADDTPGWDLALSAVDTASQGHTEAVP